MPTNDPEYQKQYKATHYVANRQRYVDQAVARKIKLRDEVWDLKRVPCADCEIEYPPWVMQFDHREGEKKVGAINKLMNNCQKAKLLKEIAKCDVVCANCHAERTYRRITRV